MSRRGKQTWWRVVIEWKLDSQDEGTRYAYVTRAGYESLAIFAAINCLIVDTDTTLDIGDTITVLSYDPHAYVRKHDELEEVT